MPFTDIERAHWTLRLLPVGARPYGRLMRLDRPIGWWLLLFPCWWGAGLAWSASGREQSALWLLATFGVFLVGAVVMRGAGCVINDIWDRNYDGAVERTATRPIPSGEVSVKQALAFCAALCAIGLLVLFWFNWPARWVALGSMGLVVIYPLAKRVTYWPQVVLGLAFNWGALVGWVAVTGAFGWPMLLLYLSGIAWTLCYDTIYAHQDKEDDMLIGVKSTALKFGAQTKPILSGFALLFWGLAMTAFVIAGAGTLALAAVSVALFLYAWQLWKIDIDDPAACLKMFKRQVYIGWIVTAAALIG